MFASFKVSSRLYLWFLKCTFVAERQVVALSQNFYFRSEPLLLESKRQQFLWNSSRSLLLFWWKGKLKAMTDSPFTSPLLTRCPSALYIWFNRITGAGQEARSRSEGDRAHWGQTHNCARRNYFDWEKLSLLEVGWNFSCWSKSWSIKLYCVSMGLFYLGTTDAWPRNTICYINHW